MLETTFFFYVCLLFSSTSGQLEWQHAKSGEFTLLKTEPSTSIRRALCSNIGHTNTDLWNNRKLVSRTECYLKKLFESCFFHSMIGLLTCLHVNIYTISHIQTTVTTADVTVSRQAIVRDKDRKMPPYIFSPRSSTQRVFANLSQGKH